MSDSDSRDVDDGNASRRSVLLGLGAGAAGAVIGASGGAVAQDDGTEETDTDSTETEGAETEETRTEGGANGGEEDEATTYVRAAHMVRGAPAVTALVDDTEVEELANVEFRDVAAYAPLSPGVHAFRAELSSMDGAAIYDARGALGAGAFTVVALGDLDTDEPPVPLVLQDEFGPGSGRPEQAGGSGQGQGQGQEQGRGQGQGQAPDRTRLRVVHAVPGAPPVRVTTGGGSTLFEGVRYAEATTYTDVPSGSRTVRIRPADDEETILAEFDATLEEGTNYTVFAAATPDGDGIDPVLATDAIDREE